MKVTVGWRRLLNENENWFAVDEKTSEIHGKVVKTKEGVWRAIVDASLCQDYFTEQAAKDAVVRALPFGGFEYEWTGQK